MLDSATNWANVSFEPNTPTLVLARTHAELNRAEKWLRLIGVNYSKVERNAVKPAVNPKSLRAITLYEQVRKREKGTKRPNDCLNCTRTSFLHWIALALHGSLFTPIRKRQGSFVGFLAQGRTLKRNPI